MRRREDTEKKIFKREMEQKATEFLLSQTRDALDNALKKSMHEREVLSTTSKVRFVFSFVSFPDINVRTNTETSSVRFVCTIYGIHNKETEKED